jgi:hypothetical protein
MAQPQLDHDGILPMRGRPAIRIRRVRNRGDAYPTTPRLSPGPIGQAMRAKRRGRMLPAATNGQLFTYAWSSPVCSWC